MKKTLFAAISISLVVLTGCVHHSPFGGDEHYLEAYGDENEIVLTLDAVRAKENFDMKSNPITDRTDRLTVGMTPNDTEVYPLPVKDWSMSGAAEGNFGSVEVGMAMNFVDGFEKVKMDGRKWWTDGTISAGVPEAGLLIFTDKDYIAHEKRTVTERELKISHEKADEMTNAVLGFYVKSPETMIDLGFDIPLSVIREMEWALIRLDETDGEWTMSADVRMTSERHARSLMTILRNQIVGEIKRKDPKARPDFKALSLIIYQDGVDTVMDDRPVTKEQVDEMYKNISELSGGLI